jgi:hypothetical protein
MAEGTNVYNGEDEEEEEEEFSYDPEQYYYGMPAAGEDEAMMGDDGLLHEVGTMVFFFVCLLLKERIRTELGWKRGASLC